MNKAVQAGLVAGYLNTCIQTTDGFGMSLKNARRVWLDALNAVETQYETKGQRREALQAFSLRNLSTCGWCLAPFITFPVWLLMARKTGLRGYMTAVSVCAFTRHIAEMY